MLARAPGLSCENFTSPSMIKTRRGPLWEDVKHNNYEPQIRLFGKGARAGKGIAACSAAKSREREKRQSDNHWAEISLRRSMFTFGILFLLPSP
jgi:hypothetical protein